MLLAATPPISIGASSDSGPFSRRRSVLTTGGTSDVADPSLRLTRIAPEGQATPICRTVAAGAASG